jgi:hypothetical protein
LASSSSSGSRAVVNRMLFPWLVCDYFAKQMVTR